PTCPLPRGHPYRGCLETNGRRYRRDRKTSYPLPWLNRERRHLPRRTEWSAAGTQARHGQASGIPYSRFGWGDGNLNGFLQVISENCSDAFKKCELERRCL